MNRRKALHLTGTAAVAGFAGCTRLLPSGGQQYQLWFIRIHNGSIEEQSVDIRVLRNGNTVFNQQYGNIPSFQDDRRQENATFAAMESARLIENEWELRSGSYEIEYRTSEQDSYTKMNVGADENPVSENVGVSMQMLGGGLNPTSVGFDVLEFDSAEQATQFLSEVTNQSER